MEKKKKERKSRHIMHSCVDRTVFHFISLSAFDVTMCVCASVCTMSARAAFMFPRQRLGARSRVCVHHGRNTRSIPFNVGLDSASDGIKSFLVKRKFFWLWPTQRIRPYDAFCFFFLCNAVSPYFMYFKICRKI